MALPAIIPILVTFASMAAQAYGSSRSAKKQKDYDKLLKGRISDVDSFFNQEYYKDFFNTDVAQSTVKVLQDRMRKESEKLSQSAVRTGATPESKIAAKGELQENYGEAMTKLLGYGTQYKDQLRQRRDYLMNNLLSMEGQNILGQQQNWATFGGNVAGSTGGLLEALAAMLGDNKLTGGTKPLGTVGQSPNTLLG